jgi:hypothetical protein
VFGPVRHDAHLGRATFSDPDGNVWLLQEITTRLPGRIGPGWPTRWGGSDSTLTVLVALGANLLVAVAKSVASVITGSASLAAEAAHSWADTGNELFLVVANRRSTRPPDQAHPLGHGREAYVWSLFAALGTVRCRGRGVDHPWCERAARSDPGRRLRRRVLGAGDLVRGLLLTVVAVQLINRNRRFLIGEEADPRLRIAVLRALLDMPEVARVTYLRLEVVGPRVIAIIGAVDLTGDDVESHLAVRLRALEDEITTSPAVAGTVLTLSASDEPPLLLQCGSDSGLRLGVRTPSPKSSESRRKSSAGAPGWCRRPRLAGSVRPGLGSVRAPEGSWDER